jgi:hypothetical protein
MGKPMAIDAEQLEVDQYFCMDDVLETLIVTRKAGRPTESHGGPSSGPDPQFILSKT